MVMHESRLWTSFGLHCVNSVYIKLDHIPETPYLKLGIDAVKKPSTPPT